MVHPREPLPTLVDDTPELPPAYAHALEAALTALGPASRISADARAIIDGHARLLLAWTTAINLTGIRDPAGVAIAHIADSLSAVPWLRARAVPTLLDLGSGGGFPGLPLAAALPDTTVTLLEPVGKKARFLETVAAATGLGVRVRVVVARAEAVAHERSSRASWSIVTARAVASSADLVELAFPLLEPGGSLIAWKRGDLGDEIDAARRAMDALGGGRLERLDVGAGVDGLGGHALLIATRTGAVPDAYPRDPTARARRAW